MSEKTEEPTDKKLDDAKKKGQSPKSQDINAAAGLMGATLCLTLASGNSLDHLSKLFSLASVSGLEAKNDQQMLAIAFDMVIQGLWIVLPFLAVSIAVGLIASFAQVGINITFEPITPNFDKVNPASGLKKLFSVRSLIELGKTVLKAVLVGTVVYVIAKGLLPLLIGAATQTPQGVVSIAWSAMLKLFVATVITLIIIGPVDFGLQKWLFIRDQRMSKDEIKREYKEMEGDPQIKGQRKQLAHELANSPPETTVPKATVVVTNPSHYAVALYYKPGETPLPTIVAKGIDNEAFTIRSIAEAHNVPVVGNPELARALFKVRLNGVMPEELFDAVAAVLRWVAMVERMGLDAASTPPGSTTRH